MSLSASSLALFNTFNCIKFISRHRPFFITTGENLGSATVQAKPQPPAKRRYFHSPLGVRKTVKSSSNATVVAGSLQLHEKPLCAKLRGCHDLGVDVAILQLGFNVADLEPHHVIVVHSQNCAPSTTVKMAYCWAGGEKQNWQVPRLVSLLPLWGPPHM